MTSTHIQILGAYKLDLTPELFRTAMDWKFGAVAFESDTDRHAAEQHVRDELAGVCLFEVLVKDCNAQFSLDDFGQPGTGQAPYSEAFLSPDGQTIILEGYDVPGDTPFRIAFYLHYVDPAKPLNTSYGTVALPAIEAMPPRLATLIPYEPVT